LADNVFLNLYFSVYLFYTFSRRQEAGVLIKPNKIKYINFIYFLAYNLQRKRAKHWIKEKTD